MAKFYKFQINDFYLTSDGSVNGDLCKTNVSGVSDLRADFKKTLIQNFDGSQTAQVYEFDSNKLIEIQIQSLPETIGEQLVTLFNSLETVDVIGSGGDTGDFSSVCEIVSFDYKEFKNGRWKNCILRLLTV